MYINYPGRINCELWNGDICVCTCVFCIIIMLFFSPAIAHSLSLFFILLSFHICSASQQIEYICVYSYVTVCISRHLGFDMQYKNQNMPRLLYGYVIANGPLCVSPDWINVDVRDRLFHTIYTDIHGLGFVYLCVYRVSHIFFSFCMFFVSGTCSARTIWCPRT